MIGRSLSTASHPDFTDTNHPLLQKKVTHKGEKNQYNV